MIIRSGMIIVNGLCHLKVWSEMFLSIHAFMRKFQKMSPGLLFTNNFVFTLSSYRAKKVSNRAQLVSFIYFLSVH